MMESIVRITAAGFGGSLVGLSLERQSASMPSATRPTIASRQVVGSLPTTWAVSCMIFASLLESTRRASPMTHILDALEASQEDVSSENNRNSNFAMQLSNYQRVALTAVGDMTLGGSVAGFAGAMAASRKRPLVGAVARPMAVWGLGVGMGLGFVTGLCQAGIDVGNLYLEQQEREQRRQNKENAEEQ
jgi:hypothetical protein